jgi:uncharacterized protein YbgA (DUF1722 family)
MEAVRLKATVKKHTNVLDHLMGYFKKDLSGDEEQELLARLMNHYVRKYEQPYLKRQVYLALHSVEPKLRNRA